MPPDRDCENLDLTAFSLLRGMHNLTITASFELDDAKAVRPIIG